MLRLFNNKSENPYDFKKSKPVPELEFNQFLFDVGLPDNFELICIETDFKDAIADIFTSTKIIH